MRVTVKSNKENVLLKWRLVRAGGVKLEEKKSEKIFKIKLDRKKKALTFATP